MKARLSIKLMMYDVVRSFRKRGPFLMKKFAGWGFSTSISLYAIFHYITLFFPSKPLESLFSLFGLFAIGFACVYMNGRRAALPFFLIGTSVFIQLIVNHSVLEGLMAGIQQMRSLVTLLLIVPLISWVLKEEPYIEEIMSFAHNLLDSGRKFYFGMMAITQVIAYFLLFGAIPMMYQFVDRFLKNEKGEAWENYKGTALLRGFSLTTMWVISIPSFVFAVEHLGASLSISVLQGFFISLCGTLLAVLFSYFQEKKYGVNFSTGIHAEIAHAIESTSNHGRYSPRITEFFILFVSLFGTIVFLHVIFKWALLLIIPPIILVWTCVYFFVKRKRKRLLAHSRLFATHQLAGKSQEITMLLGAGLLIYSLNQSGIGEFLVNGLFLVEEAVPFLNLLSLLPFVVILLGFIGLGPLTVIVFVAGILQSVNLQYTPELVVLSITSGSVISILLSPFILPVIVLSISNGLGLLKNGVQFNIGYAIAFYFLVQLYLQLMILFT
jgi:hypothetical protein